MLSILPYKSVETGPLPGDLLAAYTAAVKIAEVAHSLASCAKVPDFSLWVLISHLERLEIRGDVFTLLTANAQEINSVRDRPVTYGNIVYPNGHLVAYALWDRLLAFAWLLADSLDLVPGQCCADRFDFDVFRLSVLKGNERAVQDHFSKLQLPDARSFLAELALEVSRVARQRANLSNPRQEQAIRDDSAFRPAKEFLNPAGYPKDYGELGHALDENTWIRRDRPISKLTGRPVSNRLRVHAGDWHVFLERRKQAAPDPLDLPAHTVLAAVQEIEDRKNEERRRGAR